VDPKSQLVILQQQKDQTRAELDEYRYWREIRPGQVMFGEGFRLLKNNDKALEAIQKLQKEHPELTLRADPEEDLILNELLKKIDEAVAGLPGRSPVVEYDDDPWYYPEGIFDEGRFGVALPSKEQITAMLSARFFHGPTYWKACEVLQNWRAAFCQPLEECITWAYGPNHSIEVTPSAETLAAIVRLQRAGENFMSTLKENSRKCMPEYRRVKQDYSLPTRPITPPKEPTYSNW
jgi:hypothetical protein